MKSNFLKHFYFVNGILPKNYQEKSYNNFNFTNSQTELSEIGTFHAKTLLRSIIM